MVWNYELLVSRFTTHFLQAFLKSFPANDVRKVTVSLTVEELKDESLHVGSESLISPETVPISACNQISKPRVGDFVCDDVCETSITGE